MKRRFLAILTSAVLAVSALMPHMAAADSRKVVTLGADLDPAQKQAILRYFGVSGDNSIEILTITNQDERDHLGSYVPLEQIGTRTYSCAMVRPTSSGGIQVKTANLNWVTSNMIATTLSTSGVVNCEVLAAAPFEVSGTGALTGILMAYESAVGITLDTEKKEVATQELVTTTELANSIGQVDATKLINDIKIQIIQGNIIDEGDIEELVNETVEQEGVSLNAEDRQLLASLLEEIARQDYQYEEMRETLERVENNMDSMMNSQASAEKEDLEAELDIESVEQQNQDAAQALLDELDKEEEMEEEASGEVLGEDSILMNTDDEALGYDVLIDATSKEAIPEAVQEEITDEEAEEDLFDIVSEDSAVLDAIDEDIPVLEEADDAGEDIESVELYGGEFGEADAEENIEEIPADDGVEADIEGVVAEEAEEISADDFIEEGSADIDGEELVVDDGEDAEVEEGVVIDEESVEDAFVVSPYECSFVPDLSGFTAAGMSTLTIYIPYADFTAGDGTLTVYSENDGSEFDSVSWQGESSSVYTMPMTGSELSGYGWGEGTKATVLLNRPLGTSCGYYVELSDEAFVSADGSTALGGIYDSTLWSFETGENTVTVGNAGEALQAGGNPALTLSLGEGFTSASISSYDPAVIEFTSTFFDPENLTAEVMLLDAGTTTFTVEFTDDAGDRYESVNYTLNIR